MKHLFSTLLCLALTLACGGLHAEPQTLNPSFSAKVIHVDDGDTVTVLDAQNQKTKVRLANIDAPEASHGRCRPGQPWSAQSTRFLTELVKGKTVQLQCSTLDRYGRSVCDIEVNGTTANRLLVRAGLAWANRANPAYLRDSAVADAEKAAVIELRGLWSDPRAIPPWEWRKAAWDSAAGCEK